MPHMVQLCLFTRDNLYFLLPVSNKSLYLFLLFGIFFKHVFRIAIAQVSTSL